MAKEEKTTTKETKPVAKLAKEEKSITRSNAKPNFFQRIAIGFRRYINETTGELRKVSWPTRREAWYLTLVVLVVTGIMSLILGTFDYIFSKLFEFILQLPL